MDEHGTTILGAASTGNRRTRCPRHHGLLHHCPALLRRHFRHWFNAVLTATLQTEGIKNENCVIVSAVRTAIGSFNGSLASTSAIDRGDSN